MNKPQLKPFHESFVEFLSVAEMSLRELHQQNRSLFITRFRIAVDHLVDLLSITIVPQTALSDMANNIQSFWEAYKIIHAESLSLTTHHSDMDEKKILEELFERAITDLHERIPKDKTN